jgi:hypothetical protein
LGWAATVRTDQDLEQIWMPGVHGDIGGSSDGHFLANIALLTMVDRAKKYCPELEWNDSYLADIWNDLRRCPKFEITNERSDVFQRWLLFSGVRSIGGHKQEFVHPVFNSLADRELIIKGIRQLYNPTNYSRTLPVLAMTLDAEIADICSGQPGRRL